MRLVGLQFVAGPTLDVEKLTALEIRPLGGGRLPENGAGLGRDEGHEDGPLGSFDYLFYRPAWFRRATTYKLCYCERQRTSATA